MKTILSMLVAVATLAAPEVLAQGPASAVQSGREFHPQSGAGKAPRAARAQAQRPDRRGALDARAQQRAVAPAAFDGSWSVAINTQSGACEPSYRFRVEIIDGDVVYEGQPAGRVSPNGGVWVTVSSGGQQATGQGRLARNYGSGVWRGYGSAGSCAGSWQAERRD
jgi:Ni/Co efflux regulator RcnB